MDRKRFAASPVGRLVPITGHDARTGRDYDHVAFVPAPLPSAVALGAGTARALGDAMLALGRLDQAAQRLPNPQLLIRPTIRREAVSTSALEGTYAAFSEVLEAEFLEERELRGPVVELRNYVEAAERGLELLPTRPIARNLLCELQAMIVRGTPAAPHSGRVRDTQVVIGAPGAPIEDARFVPPPPGEMLETGLDDWERWVNAEDDLPLLVKLALAHYQFETLHPFTDGNGRVGRLVALLQIMEARVLRYPILNLSPWLERRREEYVAGLENVSATGDIERWVSFFCRAVAAQASAGVTAIDRLLSFRDDAVATLRSHRVRSVAVPIAEELIGYPVITPTVAAQRHGVSYPSANTAITRLVDIGILRQVGDRSYARMFFAPRVMEILEAAP